MTTVNLSAIRACFPALDRQLNGKQVIYFDGPGGSQVPRSVADAMSRYILESNANLGPNFATGQETIRLVAETRDKVARFLNCSSAEVSFGQNMTSLTFAFSRSLAQTWTAGDRIIVSEIDHEANISPWVLAAKERGVEVMSIPYNPDKGTVAADDLIPLLNNRTRLVAVTLSSNLIGSHVAIASICEKAHEAGALVYADATHHAPHHRIDTQKLSCDFLVCSAYKFFGPHIGILYGKADEMDKLVPYRIEPAPKTSPHCWETGTQNFAAMAGLGAALEYLLSVGGKKNEDYDVSFAKIAESELGLSEHFLEHLAQLDGFSLHGMQTTANRAPTFALTSHDQTPETLAKFLGSEGVFAWNGHMYAVRLVDALGLKRSEGVLRIGLMHYNTTEEVDRLVSLLATVAKP